MASLELLSGLAVALVAVVLTVYYLSRSSASVAPLTLATTTSSPSTTTNTDVVIIGAGVGGAALGAALALRGHRVVIIEQSLEEPHRIVGELMQPSGCQLLRDMGLGHTLEGFDAQVVTGYGIFSSQATGGEMLELDYPLGPDGNPVQGRSFHNGRFLMALRNAFIQASGGPKKNALRQGNVTQMIEDANGRVNGVSYRTTDNTVHEVTAALTVVCDGLFSKFRDGVISNTFQKRSNFLGLILVDPVYPQGRGGNVFLADPTPILLYPISQHEGRMLIDFPPERPIPVGKEAIAQFLLEHTILQLPASLHPSFKAAVQAQLDDPKSTFQQMPNRQLCARPMRKPGTLVLGDAMNVRHPLTGGGMTVCLTDVAAIVRAFEGIRDFNQHQALDTLVATHYATRSAPVAAINILADALYDVFGQKYGSLREACFDYLRRGGEMSGGPIRLLSGVSRSQTLLVCHFFSVALWGVGRACLPFPTPSAIKKSFLMLRDANIIILPLLLQEHPSWPFQLIVAALRTIFWIPRVSYVFPAGSRPPQ